MRKKSINNLLKNRLNSSFLFIRFLVSYIIAINKVIINIRFTHKTHFQFLYTEKKVLINNLYKSQNFFLETILHSLLNKAFFSFKFLPMFSYLY